MWMNLIDKVRKNCLTFSSKGFFLFHKQEQVINVEVVSMCLAFFSLLGVIRFQNAISSLLFFNFI